MYWNFIVTDVHFRICLSFSVSLRLVAFDAGPKQGDDGKKGKKKKSADLVELPFDCELPGNTDTDLQRYRDEEVSAVPCSR